MIVFLHLQNLMNQHVHAVDVAVDVADSDMSVVWQLRNADVLVSI